VAQSVAIATGALQGVAGSTDFTVSGFGTPAAAIVVFGEANSGSNPQVDGGMGIGFWDGTTQNVARNNNVDGGATSDGLRAQVSGLIAYSSTLGAEYTISNITDGVRITLTSGASSRDRFATVMLFAGVSAKAGMFTPNATQDSTASSASLGFAPKIVFVTCVGLGGDGSGTDHSILTFGFADATMNRGILRSSELAISDESATIWASETRCCGQLLAGGLTWAGEITTLGADTFTMTTRDGGSGGDTVFYLALGGADCSFDVGTLTTPTATGDSVNATDTSPDALLLMLSTATGTTAHTDSGANGSMVGMATDANEYAVGYQVEDGAATMNCNSAYSSAACLNLDSSSAGSLTHMCDATVTLNSNDFTLNYSAVDATARKGWWVAFGPPAAPVPAPEVLRSTQASLSWERWSTWTR